MGRGKAFTAAVVDVGKISGGHEKVLTGSGDGVSEFIEERCELLKIHRIAVNLDDHIGFIVGAELCGRRGEGAELGEGDVMNHGWSSMSSFLTRYISLDLTTFNLSIRVLRVLFSSSKLELSTNFE